MSLPSPSVRRLRIERLELDARGVDPAVAEAAARALGPALARTLAPHRLNIAPADRIDAGRFASPVPTGTQDLAIGIAEHIARTLRGGST